MNHKSEYEAIKTDCRMWASIKNRCIECSNFNKKKANAQKHGFVPVEFIYQKNDCDGFDYCRSNLATTQNAPTTWAHRGKTMSQAPQRSQQWHEARKSKITGSVSGAMRPQSVHDTQKPLCAAGAWFSRARERVYRQHCHRIWQNHEPLALLGYINKTGNAVDEVGFLFTQCMTGLAQALTESLMMRLF